MAVYVDDQYIPLLERCGTVRTYRENELIFMQEESADNIYFVRSGRGRIFMTTENGRELTFEIMRKGRIFGDTSFLSHTVRQVSMQAVTDMQVILCSAEKIMEIMAEEPEFMRLILRHMTDSCDDLLHQLIRSMQYNSEQKLADYLLSSTSREHPVMSFSHEDLAACLGMNRVTVTRILKHFKEKQYVQGGYGMITVLNREGLGTCLPQKQR